MAGRLPSGVAFRVDAAEAEPGQRLRALYSSAISGSVDVENVLTYNVGLTHLKSSTQFGLTLERSFTPPVRTDYPHEMRYDIVENATSPIWHGWTEDGEPVVVAVDTSALRAPTALEVWMSAARGLRRPGRAPGKALDGPLLIALTIPSDLHTNPSVS